MCSQGVHPVVVFKVERKLAVSALQSRHMSVIASQTIRNSTVC